MNSKIGTKSKEWDQSKSSINFDSFKSIIDLMLKEKKTTLKTQ